MTKLEQLQDTVNQILEKLDYFDNQQQQHLEKYVKVSLNDQQQQQIERHIEMSFAAVMAKVDIIFDKLQILIKSCSCYTGKVKLIQEQVQQQEEHQIINPAQQLVKRTGWYPENLKLPEPVIREVKYD